MECIRIDNREQLYLRNVSQRCGTFRGMAGCLGAWSVAYTAHTNAHVVLPDEQQLKHIAYAGSNPPRVNAGALSDAIPPKQLHIS
jgi:hypothetical protein